MFVWMQIKNSQRTMLLRSHPLPSKWNLYRIGIKIDDVKGDHFQILGEIALITDKARS